MPDARGMKGQFVVSAGYRTIVADPPWEIGDFPEWGSAKGTIKRPYDCLSIEQIAAIPVESWADSEADLYLWAINSWLPEAFDVARAWGFTPSATLVWCKPRKGAGLGGKFPSDVEFVIYATRRRGRAEQIEVARSLRDLLQKAGKPRSEIDAHFGTKNVSGHWFTPDGYAVNTPTAEQWKWLREWLGVNNPELDAQIAQVNERIAPKMRRAEGRWFQWPVAEHSVKPEAFLDLVEQVSPGPYLEMFSRRARLGWDTWGNEALHGGVADAV